MYFNKHIEPSHIVEIIQIINIAIMIISIGIMIIQKISNVLCHYYYLQLCHYRHYGKWHTVTALLLFLLVFFSPI